ncbi:MAG: DUF4445 domain-containing protein [SAR324 cluster bacterium]|nr:DUF4445 domain-containing protein [SAR324 cluster bacterium]
MPVRVEINLQKAEVAAGITLFQCGEKLGVRIPTSCRKNGKCRECLLEISSGMEFLSPRVGEEAHLSGLFRLACRTKIACDSGQVTCSTLKRGSIRIEESSEDLPLSAFEVPFDPAVTREGNQIFLDRIPIAVSDGPILGAAVDIGTTTVVVRVIDLETKKTVAGSSFENPQRFGGTDVLARISFDTKNKGKLLRRTLLGYLSQCLEDLPIDPLNIYEMVIAGNATMRDLFFDLKVESIGQIPYRSLTEHEMLAGKRETTSLSVPNRKFQLPIHPNARLYGLPLIGSHVGADTAACLLAIDLDHEERLVALMDIGTNTEIICGNRKRIKAASCPAGPAFEGGAINCGMPALEGAIEKVVFDHEDRVQLTVIGGKEPVGICGSGLVDTLSELLRLDKMNASGRYSNGEDKFYLNREFDIYLSENDISELAQAKGANVAGLQILLKNYGVRFDRLDVFYLAGGFARHLDIEAAKRVGLIPNLPGEKFRKIGNAAIEGAAIALYSTSRRRDLEKMVKKIPHVELETDLDFFDHFVDGCQYITVSQPQ